MALLLADGQLGITSATILGAGDGDRIISATFFNTAAAEQEITLTLTRSGSSARQFCHAKLKENEALYITGLSLDPSDILAGYTTGTASVDYLITRTPGAQQFGMLIRAEDGTPKQSADIEINTTEKFGLTRDGVVLSGLLEEVRDLLLKIA